MAETKKPSKKSPKTKPKKSSGTAARKKPAPIEATPEQATKPVERPPAGKRIWPVVAALAVIAGFFAWHVTPVPKAPPVETSKSTPSQSATLTKPLIGGPFTLVDHTGKQVTDKDFRGRYLLIYFGYTFCPDVCPTSLTALSDALDLLGDTAKQIIPIFITVDPERDTAEHLKEYVSYFHPRLVGLTGSVEQVTRVAAAYRVYYAKTREKGADEDDYLMNHSSVTYLMGPDGKFLTHFSHGATPEAMAEKLKQLL